MSDNHFAEEISIGKIKTLGIRGYLFSQLIIKIGNLIV